MPSDPPVTTATLPDRSGTASRENWFSGDASSLPGIIFPRFSAIVFLIASIFGNDDFVVTGAFNRSEFSVEYGRVDGSAANDRSCDVGLVVMRRARADLNTLPVCISRRRCRI